MTFLELYTNVQGWYKARPDLTVTLAKLFVNQAYLQMNLSFRFYGTDETFDITTVVGQTEYDTPIPPDDPALAVMRSAKIVESGEPLSLRDIGWYDEQLDGADADITATGDPTAIVRYGVKLLLYPTPDQIRTIRIRGTKRVVVLVEDADEPVYPADWHPVIEMLAASRAGFYIGEDSRAVNIKNEALGLITALQEEPSADMRNRQGQILPVVRGMRTGRSNVRRLAADDPNG